MADEENEKSETLEAVKLSIWKLGNLSPRVLLARVWQELYEGTLLTHAAALSFYFLLAIFPLLLFLITLIGFFTGTGEEMRAQLLASLSRLLPASASVLIYTTVDEIARDAGSGKLSFGILTAVWIASSGMVAIVEALNWMYGVRESRPWWKVRLIAIGLTFALTLLTISALLLILYGGEAGEWLTLYFNQNRDFTEFWDVAHVPIILAFVLFTFALIYYFAPDVEEQKWYWITPGSIVGVVLWLLVSYIFRTYLRHFDSYSVTYGSLGAVIILMLWFYLTGVTILIGGKINAEIENSAAKTGAPEAKLHGEKAPEEQN